MKFEINFIVDLMPDKRELLETYLKNTLKRVGIKPKDFTITLREKPDPIPAISIKENTNED